MSIPVTLIFDIGKTNKKLLLFDEQYNVVHEESTQLNETKDEDGFACEDLAALTYWIRQKFTEALERKDVDVQAVNFSAYGASLVHLDDAYKPLTPLYSYLKPYAEKLKQKFYKTYGVESLIAKQTSSPVLGSLNSGLQLYRLKYEQPEVYNKIKCSLHLPQYLSFILSSCIASDITSIGCHTQLWDFQKNDYHDWVYAEEIDKKLTPIKPSSSTVNIIYNNKKIKVGIGLHDSSAALIPYQNFQTEPFILLSTGTWNISFNPFNNYLLTDDELSHDCLCYLNYNGKSVKASRLFAGFEHEEQVKRIACYFNESVDYYKAVYFDHSLLKKMQQILLYKQGYESSSIQHLLFSKRLMTDFESYEEAYHQLIFDIIQQQVFSTQLVLNATPVKQIFVDGGFSKNDVYMNMLALQFADLKVLPASVPQASALGAAIALREDGSKTN